MAQPSEAPLKPWHSLSVKDAEEILQASGAGLSHEEVTKRQKEYGFNALPEEKGLHPVLVFLQQFKSFLVYILIGAALISWSIGHYVDTWLIGAIILINAIIGFVQEFRAEKAVRELQKLVKTKARVLRDGKFTERDAEELVPGDIVRLEDGDKIPADIRLRKETGFRTIEAPLTGESKPVFKNVEALFPAETGPADRSNMAWMGTYVAGGQATGMVVGTGAQTLLGSVAGSLEAIDRKEGPFYRKTRRLALQLGLIAGSGAALTFLAGFFIRGIEFTEIFLFTLASLVGGIPEGLPAIFAIVLAGGARKMASKNAIVRHLSATESVGHTSVIATDKTGTLTQNTMTVQELVLPGEATYQVTGSGWESKGEILKEGTPVQNASLENFLRVCALCNQAGFRENPDTGEPEVLGDPTEAALLVLAAKRGVTPDSLQTDWEIIQDLSFDKNLRMRASLVSQKGAKKYIWVVGAPEELLNHCTQMELPEGPAEIREADRSTFRNRIEALSSSGLRVIGLAIREVGSGKVQVNADDLKDLNFIGVAGMKDPPRDEVKASIRIAREAGIRVVMKTGDHKATALSIARELGLDIEPRGTFPPSMTGEELDQLSEADFRRAAREVNVFARLTPAHKLRLIEALQHDGDIVAMTGDGVNDAPALKRADIGIAMGKGGTEIARASGEIVLADDNFATILKAVEVGRTVFRNIRLVTFFLLTTNLAEDITILAAILSGLDLPLLPTQILWLNLITDGLVVLALAYEPAREVLSGTKPDRGKAPIISREIIPYLAIMSVAMTLITLWFFRLHMETSVETARTAAFFALAVTQLWNVLNMRSLKESIFSLGLFSNRLLVWAWLSSFAMLFVLIYTPGLQDWFSFVPLPAWEVVEILLASMSVLVIGEIYKLVKRRYSRPADLK